MYAYLMATRFAGTDFQCKYEAGAAVTAAPVFIFIQHPEITVRIQDEVLALRTYYNNYLGVDKARSGHFLYLIFTLLTQFSISRLTT